MTEATHDLDVVDVNVDGKVKIEVDVDARPQWKNPEWHRRMRDTAPVWRDPDTGVWNVFRYQEVAAISADHRAFSSDLSELFPQRNELFEGNILAMDPPRHHRLRSLVSRAFTPKAIAQLSDRITELTGQLLDEAAGRDRLELISDLAYPLPVIVIAEMLGIPAQDRALFKDWADTLLSQENPDPTDEVAIEEVTRELRKFHEYLQVHVARRRERPSRDLLSDLVAAQVDGERLDDGEIVGFATILLLAGHITTTALLGNALRCFDEHPEVPDRLRARPEALPSAIEEVLRYHAPFAQTARMNTSEVELHGQVIPAGQLISLWLVSANRDERQFEAADEFRIDRSPNPHLSFGKGIHFCIGAPLARLESRIALDIMLRRYADIRVDHSEPLEFNADPGINGVLRLPLLVRPA